MAGVRAHRGDKRELAERNQRIYALRKSGLTYATIAARFGLSKWRVCMIVEREEERRELDAMGGKCCQYISAEKA